MKRRLTNGQREEEIQGSSLSMGRHSIDNMETIDMWQIFKNKLLFAVILDNRKVVKIE